MKTVVMLVSNPHIPDPRVHKEATSLVKAGYRVSIIARNSEPESIKFESIDGYDVNRITIPIPKRLNKGSTLIYCIKYGLLTISSAKISKPDIIHCHDIYTLPMGLYLRLFTGKPLIYDSHEYYAGLHSPEGGLKAKFINLLEKAMLPFVQSIITVNPALGERYESYDPHIIMNCPVTMPLPEIDIAEIKKKYGIREDAFVIIYEGGLTHNRNLDLIVTEIAREGKKAIPGLIVLVCGSGLLESTLRMRAEENVIFTGHLDQAELSKVLACSDVGLILFEKTPNNILGLPNKLFEYMMVGIPSVVSDLPVMAKIVRDEDVGIVVDPENLEQITGAMKTLAHEPDRAAIMGKNGQKAIKLKYNWESQSMVLIELYKNISKRLE